MPAIQLEFIVAFYVLWHKFCKQMCVKQMSPFIQIHPNDGVIYAFLIEYVWNSA